MKKFFRALAIVFAILPCAIFMVACGGGESQKELQTQAKDNFVDAVAGYKESRGYKIEDMLMSTNNKVDVTINDTVDHLGLGEEHFRLVSGLDTNTGTGFYRNLYYTNDQYLHIKEDNLSQYIIQDNIGGQSQHVLYTRGKNPSYVPGGEIEEYYSSAYTVSADHAEKDMFNWKEFDNASEDSIIKSADPIDLLLDTESFQAFVDEMVETASGDFGEYLADLQLELKPTVKKDGNNYKVQLKFNKKGLQGTNDQFRIYTQDTDNPATLPVYKLSYTADISYLFEISFSDNNLNYYTEVSTFSATGTIVDELGNSYPVSIKSDSNLTQNYYQSENSFNSWQMNSTISNEYNNYKKENSIRAHDSTITVQVTNLDNLKLNYNTKFGSNINTTKIQTSFEEEIGWKSSDGVCPLTVTKFYLDKECTQEFDTTNKAPSYDITLYANVDNIDNYVIIIEKYRYSYYGMSQDIEQKCSIKLVTDGTFETEKIGNTIGESWFVYNITGITIDGVEVAEESASINLTDKAGTVVSVIYKLSYSSSSVPPAWSQQ